MPENTGNLRSRWDWYESTHDDLDDGRVPTTLALNLHASITRGRGRNGYAQCHVIERDDEVLAQVYGRSARAGEVHIQVSSEACDEVVPLIRSMYPEHRVSRVDSSVDFAADFASIDTQLLAFATDRGLSHRLVTDSDGGATRYLGSTRSEVQVRVYKKSEQLRSLHPERASEIPDGIVRFELQARPGKRATKEATSMLSPDAVWGMSQWSLDLAGLVLDVDAERVSTHFRRPPDWTRALHFLGEQYGPSVARRIEQVGVDRARTELLVALGVSP